VKNPDDRFDWSGLIMHPFWQNSLQHLIQDMDNTVNEDLRESLRRSVANFTGTLGLDNRPLTAGGGDQAVDQTNSTLGFSRNDDNRSGQMILCQRF
jgi:hypothetical protein